MARTNVRKHQYECTHRFLADYCWQKTSRPWNHLTKTVYSSKCHNLSSQHKVCKTKLRGCATWMWEQRSAWKRTFYTVLNYRSHKYRLSVTCLLLHNTAFEVLHHISFIISVKIRLIFLSVCVLNINKYQVKQFAENILCLWFQLAGMNKIEIDSGKRVEKLFRENVNQRF